MDKTYLIAPFLSWFVTGSVKFLLNSIKNKRFAFDLIGYGGMPSNHAAITSCMTFLIAFKDGINASSFGISLTFTFITILDAVSLRGEVGRHAVVLNKIADIDYKLRERVGHTRVEIAVGILVGFIVALMLVY